MRLDREEGFTLIEMMVGVLVFAVATTAFYQLLFSSTRGSERAQAVVRTSEEARLALNRMVRDTREASRVLNPSATSYTVEIDFNGNGTIDSVPADPTGSYERIMFTFNAANREISVSAGTQTETLMQGVDCVRKPDNTCHDVFSFGSSRLEWDKPPLDGRVSTSPLGGELDDAPGVGNENNVLDATEVDFIDVVSFALRVIQQGSDANFYADAQLRNRR